ncbi:NAD(P)-dependent oxidoreductase [Streptomyces sp. NPDC056190]|uniref:NAD(P)-dependent oxidoreductase n=1 Tax=Streptomyces sp. NPDC056190 TaxID=3345741 RepID=UPI0035DEB983
MVSPSLNSGLFGSQKGVAQLAPPQGAPSHARSPRTSPSAILVNTSRGPIIDQDPLLDTLRRKAIRCAALDVHDVEPLLPDHPFRTLPNTVLTPHIGYLTRELYEIFQAGRPIRVVTQPAAGRRRVPTGVDRARQANRAAGHPVPRLPERLGVLSRRRVAMTVTGRGLAGNRPGGERVWLPDSRRERTVGAPTEVPAPPVGVAEVPGLRSLQRAGLTVPIRQGATAGLRHISIIDLRNISCGLNGKQIVQQFSCAFR